MVPNTTHHTWVTWKLVVFGSRSCYHSYRERHYSKQMMDHRLGTNVFLADNLRVVLEEKVALHVCRSQE